MDSTNAQRRFTEPRQATFLDAAQTEHGAMLQSDDTDAADLKSAWAKVWDLSCKAHAKRVHAQSFRMEYENSRIAFKAWIDENKAIWSSTSSATSGSTSPLQHLNPDELLLALNDAEKDVNDQDHELVLIEYDLHNSIAQNLRCRVSEISDRLRGSAGKAFIDGHYVEFGSQAAEDRWPPGYETEQSFAARPAKRKRLSTQEPHPEQANWRQRNKLRKKTKTLETELWKLDYGEVSAAASHGKQERLRHSIDRVTEHLEHAERPAADLELFRIVDEAFEAGTRPLEGESYEASPEGSDVPEPEQLPSEADRSGDENEGPSISRGIDSGNSATIEVARGGQEASESHKKKKKRSKRIFNRK